MSTYLRKCIDIAPTAIITPGLNPPNDYPNLRLQPWWPALRATTSHLRLWADWPSFQHWTGPARLDADGRPSLAALDAQVEAAHARRPGVILIRIAIRAGPTRRGIAAGPQRLGFLPLGSPRAARSSTSTSSRALRPRADLEGVRYRLPPDGTGRTARGRRYVAWLWERYADR